MKPSETDKTKILMNKIKKIYLTKVKGFDPNQIVAATCLFEGPKDLVALQKK